MLVDQPQAITLPRRQYVDSVRDVSQRPLQSLNRSKRRLSRLVYFDERIHAPRVVLLRIALALDLPLSPDA